MKKKLHLCENEVSMHTHTHDVCVAAKTIELQGWWRVVLLRDMCEMVN